MSRIDTHCHVIPPFYRAWLEIQPNPGPILDWNVNALLEYLDANQIDTGILSLSTPGTRMPFSADAAHTRRLTREVNDFTADVVRDRPERLGFFATLTLPDVEGAIAEAEYALDTLHADGVVLLTNADGVYLGAPEWDPLLDYLDGRGTVVFVHPTTPAAPPGDDLPASAIDFVHDSVRAAITLARNGCLDRFPRLRFLLSHGGGYLPFTALRLARTTFPTRPVDEAIALLQRFYLDTALTGGPYALPSLFAFARPDGVTFGSDWPYAPIPIAMHFTAGLDAFPLLPEQRDAVNHGTAEALFPRLSLTRKR